MNGMILKIQLTRPLCKQEVKVSKSIKIKCNNYCKERNRHKLIIPQLKINETRTLLRKLGLF